ncbi:MAG: class II fumarate hydratase [Eubacteriales bacterium]|nr:class II fumarate hydratase [Eubacteriales bacterium]
MEDKKFRKECDTMGEIMVPADKYWGAQTQRSYQNFRIGTEKIPMEVIRAFAILKKSAAEANVRLGMLDEERGRIIKDVCDEILEGRLDENFPLSVWQTGSGTQSNMNVNEVIAHRAAEISGGKLDFHPNNHVNCSQSSNDTFPTAMHIAAVKALDDRVLPAVKGLKGTFDALSEKYMDIIKIGRTHLQDATPLTLGQEISGWAAMLGRDIQFIEEGRDAMRDLAVGGTAVGTGLNAPEKFGDLTASIISELTGEHFESAPNKFQALSSKDQIAYAHGTLKTLAADMMKIANDVRWLTSGPRCGIGELRIPANEPGSSIMPGKVNPTQCEAVTMTAVQVMGNDVTVGMAASQGNFELNVFMPVIIYNFLQSAALLADAADSFNKNCAVGIEPVREKIDYNLRNSLMLVTALNRHIGYDNAAKIAKKAHAEGTTLKEAAVTLGLLTEEQFDEYVDPSKMVGPVHEQQ